MRILIIDDESLIRRSLRRAFENKMHEVHEAEDGQHGFDMWHKVRPDIVLLDVMMPGLTGPQLLNRMVDRLGAKVILMSAYTGEYDLKKAQDMGAKIFINKPFENIFEIVKIAETI